MSKEFNQNDDEDVKEEVFKTPENGLSNDTQKQSVDDFRSKVQKISEVSDRDTEVVMELEKETKNKAHQLEVKEDNKIKDLSNLLIDIQLSKLESKIQFLEEYEKIIWNEKKQLEVLQKMQIADRVQLALKRNELSRQVSHQHQGLPNNINSNLGNLISNGPGNLMNQHSQHHMLHKDDKLDLHGNLHLNVNVDDMLNLGGMDRMDEEYGKGDQL